VAEAVQNAFKGSPGQKQDLSGYSYYSHPKFNAYQALRRQGHVLIRLYELRDAIEEEAKRSIEGTPTETV
jgi:hypothetical protein